MKLFWYECLKLITKKTFILLMVMITLLNAAAYVVIRNTEPGVLGNDSEQQDYTVYVQNAEKFQNALDSLKEYPAEEAAKKADEQLKIYNTCFELALLGSSEGSADLINDRLAALKSSSPEIYQQVTEISQKDMDFEIMCLIYDRVAEQYHYIAEYDSFIDEMKDRANRLTTFSAFSSIDSFSYDNIVKTPSDYEALKGTSLVPGNYYGIKTATNSMASNLFFVAAILIICVYLFLWERNKSLLILIKSTKFGHLRTAVSKLSALAAGVILAGLLIFGTDIILELLLGTPIALNAPVQSFGEFLNCNFKITVGQYLILWLAVKLLTGIMISFVFAWVFLFIKNAGGIYLVCFSLILLSETLYYVIDRQSPIHFLKFINPAYFLDTYNFLRYYTNINLFSKAINTVPVYIVYIIFITAVFAVLSCASFSVLKQISEKDLFSKIIEKLRIKFGRIRGSVRIINGESFKLFIQNKSLLVLSVLAAFAVISSSGSFNSSWYSVSTATYHNYLERLEGELTEEKVKFIENEQKYFDFVKQKLIEYEAQEHITEEQQNEISGLKSILEGQYAGYQMLMKQYRYLQEQHDANGTPIYFIDEEKYGHILADTDLSFNSFITAVIALMLALGNIFAFEHKRKLPGLLRATKNGRLRLFTTKYCVGLISFFIIYLCSYLPRIIKFFRQYGGIISDAPASSMRVFKTAPQGMTISLLLVFILLADFLILFSIAAIIISLSEITESSFLTLIISSIIFLFLPFLQRGNELARIYFAIGSGRTGLVLTIITVLAFMAVIFVTAAAKKYIGNNFIKLKKGA